MKQWLEPLKYQTFGLKVIECDLATEVHIHT